MEKKSFMSTYSRLLVILVDEYFLRGMHKLSYSDERDSYSTGHVLLGDSGLSF